MGCHRSAIYHCMNDDKITQGVFAYHPPSSRRGMMTNGSEDEKDKEDIIEERLLRRFIKQTIAFLAKR